MIWIPGVASRGVGCVVLRQGKRIGGRRSISQRRPGERRGPYAAASRFCEGVCDLALIEGATRLMVWTAPYGIECARMRLLQISDKGAVRERDYPNWHGYVEVYFSTTWG